MAEPHQTEKTGRSWVTVVGWSPMAVINTLWQSCEEGFVPDRVVLLASPTEDSIQRSVKTVEQYLRAILPRFGVAKVEIERQPINEDDFTSFRDKLEGVLKSESQLAAEVIVDTTPGRKYMSAFAFALGLKQDPRLEKVYYNHMLDMRYNDVPNPLIPRHEQQLYDFFEVLVK